MTLRSLTGLAGLPRRLVRASALSLPSTSRAGRISLICPVGNDTASLSSAMPRAIAVSSAGVGRMRSGFLFIAARDVDALFKCYSIKIRLNRYAAGIDPPADDNLPKSARYVSLLTHSRYNSDVITNHSYS
ncbi:hypothetical protein CBM2587_B60260 [Cupriavidus taiwanensis]|uniref:Uncharacterized protein n=1 Tax=Cupriavidus taiwanensis TaxID=164546 RepID=A0A975XBW7_9BURK|nr:hypothetical protein CBM2587_B60260 [Cupriavidus taiwanensis]